MYSKPQHKKYSHIIVALASLCIREIHPFLGSKALVARNVRLKALNLKIHRFLLCSYAETNLKKQGMLPFTFSDPSDYDKVQPTDRVSLLGLAELAPGKVSSCEMTIKQPSLYTLITQLIARYMYMVFLDCRG